MTDLIAHNISAVSTLSLETMEDTLYNMCSQPACVLVKVNEFPGTLSLLFLYLVD